MTKAPMLGIHERRRTAAEIFRDVLGPSGLAGAVDENELNIRSKVIVEPTHSRKLSDAILDAMFPTQQGPVELFHYTNLVGLRGIAISGELRLYSVRKRVDEGELKTFAMEHKLNGYLDTSAGAPYYKELSDDLFYASFTREMHGDSAGMWALFGDHGKGLRLKMRLMPQQAELRPIQYAQRSRTILNDLNERLDAAGIPPFLPWTISRIGAFYLPSSLAPESEVRLLVKRYGAANAVRSDGNYEYLPVPIAQADPICAIDVIEIAAGPSGDIGQVRNAIRDTQFESLPLARAL